MSSAIPRLATFSEASGVGVTRSCGHAFRSMVQLGLGDALRRTCLTLDAAARRQQPVGLAAGLGDAPDLARDAHLLGDRSGALRQTEQAARPGDEVLWG